MNKNEVAKKATGRYDLARSIWINKRKFKEWEIGDIYNNYGDAESWAGGEGSFDSRTDDLNAMFVEVVLIGENITAHKVNYDNLEEVDELTAFLEEDEYLVAAETKLRIIDISSDDDYEEMKYYIVEVEEI